MKKDLRLTSFFSMVSIPVMVVAVVMLVFIYRLVVIEGLQKQVEQNNITVTKSLSNVIWEQISVLELMPDTKESWTLNDVYIDVITQDIYKYLHGTPVLKVKVYNIAGKTVYSSDKKEIGEVKPEHYPGRVVLDTLEPISSLTHRGLFQTIEGDRANIEILATYIPKYNEESRKVEGVFEIYTDVTEPMKEIKRGLFNFTAVLILIFALVYGALYVMVTHADKIILRNKNDLKDKIKETESMNLVLEDNSRELAVARDLATHANIAKSQFLANMSHELRTPLNAIIGYTELLIEATESYDEAAENYDNEEVKGDLDKVHAAGTHLLELINGILDLSKVEAGQMQLHRESFDISQLLNEVVDTVKPIVQKNYNEIKMEVDFDHLMMFGDILKIRQILFNLISNSAKFTKNGIITLASRLLTVNGERKIVFEVSDTGIGIAQEHLDKLFDPFEQGDTSTTRAYGGTGLGLTITKRFCNIMDGEIEVDSEEGKGTKFIVYIAYHEDPVMARQAV